MFLSPAIIITIIDTDTTTHSPILKRDYIYIRLLSIVAQHHTACRYIWEDADLLKTPSPYTILVLPASAGVV